MAGGYSDTNLVAGDKRSDYGAIALGYNVQSLAEASVTLGKDLTNYNANSVLVNDLNVAGNAMIDGDLDAAGKEKVCGSCALPEAGSSKQSESRVVFIIIQIIQIANFNERKKVRCRGRISAGNILVTDR